MNGSYLWRMFTFIGSFHNIHNTGIFLGNLTLWTCYQSPGISKALKKTIFKNKAHSLHFYSKSENFIKFSIYTFLNLCMYLHLLSKLDILFLNCTFMKLIINDDQLRGKISSMKLFEECLQRILVYHLNIHYECFVSFIIVKSKIKPQF